VSASGRDRISIQTFAVGALGCNCTILCDRQAGEAIVIDPGGDYRRIAERLAALEARAVAIVHTHTHIDHVGATAPLAEAANVTPQIHQADRFLYDMLPVQSALVGLAQPRLCDVRDDLGDGRTVTAGCLELGVLHTPGHSPGSVSFLLRAAGSRGAVAFTGDTLFRGSVGRTDLWGGDMDVLLASLRQRLMVLDDDTRVIPGHGPETTIELERRNNPFLRGSSLHE